MAQARSALFVVEKWTPLDLLLVRRRRRRRRRRPSDRGLRTISLASSIRLRTMSRGMLLKRYLPCSPPAVARRSRRRSRRKCTR